jgi:hypothetical protein
MLGDVILAEPDAATTCAGRPFNLYTIELISQPVAMA